MKELIPTLPGLSPICGKEIQARFDGGRLSSDGGVLVLREIERGLGLAELLSSCIHDRRDPSCVTHICFSRDTVLSDRPSASGPINTFKASPISPLDMPFKYSHGSAASRDLTSS